MYRSVIIYLSFLSIAASCTLIVNADVVHSRHKRAGIGVIEGPKRLIDEPICAPLKQMCANELAENDDFLVLECIQNLKSEQKDQLTEVCETIIWRHIHELVEDKNVQKLLEQNCKNDFSKFECKVTEESGNLLACVLTKKEDITGPECKAFIQRLELVAFSDFKLIAPFAQSCREDVERMNCGRLGGDSKQWSQGETIACLQNHLQEQGEKGLTEDCKKSILQLSELQAVNYKLDWKLYKACLKVRN